MFVVAEARHQASLGVNAEPKERLFVCPVVSCSEMFRTMAERGAHLRAHTVQQPSQPDEKAA